ncbi:hypothetical protein C8Q80DRAFT_1120158 [Daedaleopsis nitida]|nr:hypothetical protein C8Q80DRAFT_1120158 [Daedaleopsis nitida]
MTSIHVVCRTPYAPRLMLTPTRAALPRCSRLVARNATCTGRALPSSQATLSPPPWRTGAPTDAAPHLRRHPRPVSDGVEALMLDLTHAVPRMSGRSPVTVANIPVPTRSAPLMVFDHAANNHLFTPSYQPQLAYGGSALQRPAEMNMFLLSVPEHVAGPMGGPLVLTVPAGDLDVHTMPPADPDAIASSLVAQGHIRVRLLAHLTHWWQENCVWCHIAFSTSDALLTWQCLSNIGDVPLSDDFGILTL